MAEEDRAGGNGAWSFVLMWDGSPQTWRAFKQQTQWWTSSLDLEGTMKYNLSARCLIRQNGIVRQRGEEFDARELMAAKAVTEKDDDGAVRGVTPADPLAGINKLMSAFESMKGRSQLDKRGELRRQFFLELKRRPGERISEFCARLRVLVADLKTERVALPAPELGCSQGEDRFPYKQPGPPEQQQAYAAEVEDEPAAQEEETEDAVEVLAAELEEAAEVGVDDAVLAEMEDSVETAAEALMTMREARTKLQEVKKDRGFGKVGMNAAAKAKSTSVQEAVRQVSLQPAWSLGW
ncbi:unnamed protein product [Effrenium voratum]|nr:unnamed protein product [Effrenium voratum]